MVFGYQIGVAQVLEVLTIMIEWKGTDQGLADDPKKQIQMVFMHPSVNMASWCSSS